LINTYLNAENRTNRIIILKVMSNLVNQGFAWSVVTLPSARCRGAGISGVCRANFILFYIWNRFTSIWLSSFFNCL